MTLRMVHPDLESCVGLATAAFALEVLRAGVVVDNGAEGGGATTTKTMMTVEPGVWFRVEGEAGEDEYIEDGEGGCFRLRPWREFSIDVICIVIVFLCAFKGVRRVFEYNVKASRAESISSRCRRCHRHRCGTANSAGQVMS